MNNDYAPFDPIAAAWMAVIGQMTDPDQIRQFVLALLEIEQATK